MLLPGPSSSDAEPGIRLATPADNPALATLLGLAFPEMEWSADRVERELTGFSAISAVFVIDDGDTIIATAATRHWPERFPDAGFLAWVGVDPAYRGRGLGRAVTARAVTQFVEEGLSPVILETDDERLPAMATYLGLGFVPHYLDSDHAERWSRVFIAMNAAQHARDAS
jgi:mycothiol synthase